MENRERRSTAVERRSSLRALRWLLPLLAAAVTANAQVVGWIDTIGGTTYDLQFPGADGRLLVYDTAYGLNAAWTFSASQEASFPDADMRYNFWDESTRKWVFSIDTGYMNWGVDVFHYPTGEGSLDVDPITGRVYISATQRSTTPASDVARSISPGSGTFQVSNAPEGFVLPQIAVGQTGRVHVAFTSRADSLLYYARMSSWDTWSEPARIAPPMPDPTELNYVVAAAKSRPSVCIAWLASDRGVARAYLARLTDDGANWLPTESLSFPATFHPGSDTQVAAFGILPWYDPDEEPPGEQENLHVIASLVPVVGETTLSMPAEIWHWSQAWGWSMITRAGAAGGEHALGSVGYNAAYACRPTMAREPIGRELVCVWEQFDSTNLEFLTGRFRADIWMARGDSSGQYWSAPVKITVRDGTSKRFPCLASHMRGDTCAIFYEIDRVAGFAVQQEGPTTLNPIVVQWLPLLRDVVEEPRSGNLRLPTARLDVWPNPCEGILQIRSSQAASSGHYQIQVHDASGKRVRQIGLGTSACATADLRDLPSGVYFLSLTAPAAPGHSLVLGAVKLTLKK